MSEQNEYEKTAQILQKFYLPVGEERDIEIDLGDEKLVFRARVLSSAEMAKLRRKYLNLDNVKTVEDVAEANEQFNSELVEKVIIEPKVDIDKLPEPIREVLLEEIYNLHGYGGEEMKTLLEKNSE
ncbi:hypothetical protein DRP05_10590 [Archaeoglobales archaeon]|nr:MAG: hypothetical protein DRP05_10590 [Archaeoglobales archaeon]